MSWLCVAWAEKVPVADVYERSIITLMSHRARSDGTGAYPSIAAMANYAICDEQSIRRRLKTLKARGVIAPGDQDMTRHLPGDKRPTVYDLQIPYSWYSAAQLEEVNADRAEHGHGPLDPDARPPIEAPPKARKQRADTGVPKPRRRSTQVDEPAEATVTSADAAPYLRDTPSTNSPAASSSEDGLSTRYPAGYLQDESRGDYEIPNTDLSIPSVDTDPGGAETPAPPDPPVYREDPALFAGVVSDQDELAGDVTTRARTRERPREKTPPAPRHSPEAYPEPTDDDRQLYGVDLHKPCTGHCHAPPGRLCVKFGDTLPLVAADGPHLLRRHSSASSADLAEAGPGQTRKPARKRAGVTP